MRQRTTSVIATLFMTLSFWLLVSSQSFALVQTLVPKFAYVVNAYDSSLSICSIDSETGRLRQIGHVDTGMFPSSVVVHPSGNFVYVTEQTGHKVAAFNINKSNGRLTKMSGSPFDPKVVSPFWSDMDKDGRFLYIAGRNSNAVTAMSINAETGALSLIEGAPFAGGFLPRSVIVHPSDRFVYMVSINDDSVIAYSVNDKTGGLTEIKGSPFSVGDAPQYMAIDPTGKFAFVTSWNTKSLLVFDINQQTGYLKEIQAVKLGSQAAPFGINIHPSGKFVYVANWFGGTQGFTVDPATGKLAEMKSSPYRNFGDQPVQVIVEPSGQFAYVTNFNSNTLTAYKIDSQTGELVAGHTSSSRTGPRAMAFLMSEKPSQRSSQFAFVSNAASNTLNAYKVSRKNGSLDFVAMVKTGKSPGSLAVDASNRFVYVANTKSNSVSAFEINSENGKLTEVNGSPFSVGENPTHIEIDANGRYVYVINAKSNSMSVFLKHDTGFLIELKKTNLHYASPYVMSEAPGEFLISPTERISYVLNKSQNKVSFYGHYADAPLVVESVYGSPVTVIDKPVSMAIEPDGLVAYIIGENKSLAAYDVNVRTGILTQKGEPVRTGDMPVSLTIAPSGRYVYVVNKGSDSISIYEMDEQSGKIKNKLKDIKVGKAPGNIIIESSGRFAYVLNEKLNEINIFSLNQHNGDLKQVAVVKTGLSPVSMALTSEIN